MKLIKPEIEHTTKMLELGDVLVDDEGLAYMLTKTREGYMFTSLDGNFYGYNGQHTTLESITKRTFKDLRINKESLNLYRKSEYDLKLVPKGE
jgi:hypothetical protein